ncbi:MAG: LPXTG cell wall anchor domain-containing protein [Saccharofermentanales bacterium]
MGSDAVRLDNKEITIPQTGGIGTVIFVVAGLAIMAFAVIAMRRNNKKDNT